MGNVRLIDCPVCNGKVSSAAKCCPHCGHPLKSTQVAKIVSKLVWRSGDRQSAKTKKAGLWGDVDTPLTGKTPIEKLVYVVLTAPLILCLAWIFVIIPGVVSGITARIQEPCYDYMVQIMCDPPNGVFLTLSFTYAWPLLAIIKKVWGRIVFFYLGFLSLIILWPIAVFGPLTLYPIDLVMRDPERIGIFVIMATIGYGVSLIPTCCLTKWVFSALPGKSEECSKK